MRKGICIAKKLLLVYKLTPDSVVLQKTVNFETALAFSKITLYWRFCRHGESRVHSENMNYL